MKMRLKSLLLSSAALLGGATLVPAQTSIFGATPYDLKSITGSIAPSTGSIFPLGTVGGKSISANIFRRLPLDAVQLRFDGEMGAREMPIFVRQEHLNEKATLKIRYQNSVAVMPEASELFVHINGTQVGSTYIEGAAEAGTLQITLPPGTFEAGYNALRISVQQRHRVDCSLDATNELWTQVDTAASGITFETVNDSVSRAEDLLWLPLGDNGTMPITIVTPANADTASIDRSIRAAQALAIRAGYLKPQIQFSRENATAAGTQLAAAGIQLMVGTVAELRSRGLEASPFGESAVTLSGRANGTIRVMVSGSTTADIDDTINRLATEKAPNGPIGSAAGLRALKNQIGVRLDPESSITLGDIGFTSQDFNGRSYSSNFNVILPPDFYPADNGKATIMLDANYAAGLSSSNEVLIRVNGKIVGASRLPKTSGETIRRRPIEVSLRNLQPGINNIGLEIRTASDSDADCNPLSMIDAKRRLMVMEQTSITLPRIARVNYLPNISAMASTGFPFVEKNKSVSLYMPRPDFGSLGSAATILARTAVAAGQTINTHITLTAPDETTEAALIVGSIADMPTALSERFGIHREDLPATWSKSGAAEAKRLQQANPGRPPVEGFGEKANAPTSTPNATGKPGDSWEDPAAKISAYDRYMQPVSAFLQRIIGFTPDQLSFLTTTKSSFIIPQTAKLVVAETQGTKGSDSTWMMVLGPDSQTLQKEVSALVSHSSWTQLAGRTAAFDPGKSQVTYGPVSSIYHYDLRDRSFHNVTNFAAGWLSNNVQYYVLVILIFCSMFAIFTRKLMKRIGVQV